jgi:hypothetical protein
VLENSGFAGGGGWDDHVNAFDNEYYTTLLNNQGTVDTVFVQERQMNVAAGRPFPDQFLWREGNVDPFMFNVDMALVVDFGTLLDSTSGRVTCTLGGVGPNVCAASRLLSHTREFANNDLVWRQAFHDAFVKMTDQGCMSSGACTVV